MFYGSGLETFTVPDSITSIGDSAFLFCNNLKEFHFGSGVSTINPNWFKANNDHFDRNIINITFYLLAQFQVNNFKWTQDFGYIDVKIDE